MKYVQDTGEVYKGGRKTESGLFINIIWASILQENYKLSFQTKATNFNAYL